MEARGQAAEPTELLDCSRMIARLLPWRKQACSFSELFEHIGVLVHKVDSHVLGVAVSLSWLDQTQGLLFFKMVTDLRSCSPLRHA
jgi:hypothetical protein